MKPLVFHLVLFCCLGPAAFSQNIGIGTNTPNSSAKMDIQSENSGILIPRMSTSQRLAIPNPAKGLMVFDNDKAGFLYFDGLKWVSLLAGNSNEANPMQVQAAASDSTSLFGHSVSIDSNIAAISSYKTTPNGGQSPVGLVFIYEKTAAGDWVKLATLDAPEPVSGSEHFGHATDISGDYLIVGAPFRKNNSGVSVGAAFIYRRTGNNWNLEGSLFRGAVESASRSGFDVAIDVAPDGTVRAVVGTPMASGGSGSGTGYVAVYKRSSSGNWGLEQNITAPDLPAGAQAGYSVDIDDSLVVYGAPYFENTVNATTYHRRGIFYIYKYTGSGWSQDYSLMGGNSYNGLGFSVCVSNALVAVGAPGVQLNASNNVNGFVYILTRHTGSWQYTSLQSPLELRDNGAARFGMSVSVNRNKLLVGAPASLHNVDISASDYAGYRPGTVYLYHVSSYPGIYWVMLSLIKTFNAGYNTNVDYFGQSLSIGRGNYIISNHNKGNDLKPYGIGAVRFGSLD